MYTKVQLVLSAKEDIQAGVKTIRQYVQSRNVENGLQTRLYKTESQKICTNEYTVHIVQY